MPERENLYQLITATVRILDDAERLTALRRIRGKYAARLKTDPAALDYFLSIYVRPFIGPIAKLADYEEVLRICKQRLKLDRPATRTTYSFVFLITDFLESARLAEKPKPYLYEVLDRVRFLEDIVSEPAAVYALEQMVKYRDFKTCGKAIYVFKKVARRYGTPDLQFTRESVAQLSRAYKKKYLNFRWE